MGKRTILDDRGTIEAGYYFFVRTSTSPSDKAVLLELDVDHYAVVDDLPQSSSRANITIGSTEDWLLIVDDELYSMWNHRAPVERFVASFDEALICFMGDTDNSLHFSYWHSGKCRRTYAFDAALGRNPATLNEVGQAIPGEAEALALEHQKETLREISEALGFNASAAQGSFRTYADRLYVRDIGPFGSAITSVSQEQWERRREESIAEQIAAGAVWRGEQTFPYA